MSHSKKIITTAFTLLSLAFASFSFAANEGFYVSIAGGSSTIRTPQQNTFSPSGVENRNLYDTGGFGGRVAAGYAFNPYWGMEFGYAHFARSFYLASQTGGNDAVLKISAEALELVGTAHLPLLPGFDLFTSAGVSYVMQDRDYSNPNAITFNTAVMVTPKNGIHNQRVFRPVASFGASYDFTNHLTGAISISRTFGRGNIKTNTDAVADIDTALAALYWYF